MEREVYPYNSKSDVFKTRFYNNPDISNSNKEAVKEFITKQEALGVGDRRITKLFSNLKTILTIIYPGFDLRTAKESELIELSKRIKATDYKPNTKKDFHVVIKRYYRVVEGRNARYPEKLDFFRVSKTSKTTKGPKDLVSRKELDKLLRVCINNRDKAIFMVLYEGGLRVGELCNLDINDVKLTDDGVELHVPDKSGCKSGPRDIWLTEAYSTLRDWIKCHPNPMRGNPLFVTLEGSGKGPKHKRIDQGSVRTMLCKKAILSGLPVDRIKMITPHRFRHTCATEKAVLGFSESQLNAFMGWKQGSNMAGTYIHMTGKGVKKAYKEALGLPTDKTKAYRECPKCGYESNSFLSVDCGRCGTSLDAKKKQDLIDYRDKQLRFINALMEVNPELIDLAKDTLNNKKTEIEKLLELE